MYVADFDVFRHSKGDSIFVSDHTLRYFPLCTSYLCCKFRCFPTFEEYSIFISDHALQYLARRVKDVFHVYVMRDFDVFLFLEDNSICMSDEILWYFPTIVRKRAFPLYLFRKSPTYICLETSMFPTFRRKRHVCIWYTLTLLAEGISRVYLIRNQYFLLL